MAYVEILNSAGVTVEQWERRIAKEYIGQLFMKNFMGEGSDECIQVKRNLMKLPGDAINIGIRSQLIGGYVSGNSTGIGNEGYVNFFNQSITVNNVRHLVKIQDVHMSQKRVGWDVLNQAREALVEKARIRLDQDIITALNATGNSRVSGRHLYGALTSNYNATHATGLANVDGTSDKLTTNMVRIAKRMAGGVTGTSTARIRPMRVKVGKNFEEWYVFIGHPLAIRDMIDDDAAWRNSQLLLPPGGNRQSPIFTGSAFKGSYDGVLCYEYDGIPLSTNTNSVQCAHNIFMGAQAGAVVWGQMPKFGEESNDVGHQLTYEIHEIRNEAALLYDRNSVDSSTNEWNGHILVYSAAVAD